VVDCDAAASSFYIGLLHRTSYRRGIVVAVFAGGKRKGWAANTTNSKPKDVEAVLRTYKTTLDLCRTMANVKKYEITEVRRVVVSVRCGVRGVAGWLAGCPAEVILH
jgi:hypothetical protein